MENELTFTFKFVILKFNHNLCCYCSTIASHKKNEEGKDLSQIRQTDKHTHIGQTKTLPDDGCLVWQVVNFD